MIAALSKLMNLASSRARRIHANKRARLSKEGYQRPAVVVMLDRESLFLGEDFSGFLAASFGTRKSTVIVRSKFSRAFLPDSYSRFMEELSHLHVARPERFLSVLDTGSNLPLPPLSRIRENARRQIR
jgi:hypothetical protein